jgi:hypothetical protein
MADARVVRGAEGEVYEPTLGIQARVAGRALRSTFRSGTSRTLPGRHSTSTVSSMIPFTCSMAY